MIIRDMFDTRVKICKVCQGHVDKKMVIRDDYKGHLFYGVDCGTEYKIVGEGQAENELEVEYERPYRDPERNCSTCMYATYSSSCKGCRGGSNYVSR